MKILYKDIFEFAEVTHACIRSVEAGVCYNCPLYEQCSRDSISGRAVMQAEILKPAHEFSKEEE